MKKEKTIKELENGNTFIITCVSILGILALLITAVVMSIGRLDTLIIKLNDNVVSEEINLTNKLLVGFFSSIITVCIPAGFYSIRFTIKSYYRFRERRHKNENTTNT
jgi:hypothetical protein